MVKWLYAKKIFWLTITFFVIVDLALWSYIFAKQLEIKSADVERIKTSLEITQTALKAIDLFAKDNDLMTILNTVVEGGKMGANITYGLLVLSAINEMDLVDLVVSGRYRDEAREYFNSVLEQTTGFTSYWKSTGQNIFSLMRRGSAVTPTTGLAMESIAILEKTMNIIISTKNWLTVETYNGMWRYFQERIGGESHQQSWSYAMVEMGRADQIEMKNNELFVAGKKSTQQKDSQLEQQFLTLYDNWAPYVTPFGISEEYKKQVKEELSNTLVAALKTNPIAREEFKPSLVDKLYSQLENIKNWLADMISRINLFRAGPIIDFFDGSTEELIEAGPQSIEAEPLEEVNIIEQIIPEETPEVGMTEAGPLSIATTTIPELSASATEPVTTPELPPMPVSLPAPTIEPTLCERGTDNPKRFKVLINEVGWMGTTNSSNDEYIELKNIYGIPINLSGWQLLDKDRQIKIIFGENNILPANGFYLLERTNDDTVPGITADFIYTGALNNTNEILYLFDKNCQLEDEVVANPNWPAGDNLLKKSMARFDLLNWYTSIDTPGIENSSPPAIYSSAGTLAPTPESEPVSAPEPQEPLPNVVINEIAWMGTQADSADEWIELYNNTSATIDLTNWTLKAADDAPSISFSTSTIAAKSYFLLERTSDNTVSDIAADLIYTGALSNSGEKLELRDASGNLIDAADCSSAWSAGAASPNYVSMERINPSSGASLDNWASNNRVPWDGWVGKDTNSNRINGTPKSQNSVAKSSTVVSAGGFTIDDDFTLTLLSSPYLVEGSINVSVGAKLTIEPGVAIKFKHNNTWKSALKVKGTLAAIGTETQKIIFTSSSTAPAAGDWEWLYFENASSTLKNIVIQYAGKKEGNPPENPPYTKGAIYVDGGNIEISNSKIEESQTLGVWLANSALATIDGVEFSNLTGNWEKAAAVYIEKSSPVIKNSTFKNNEFAIWVEDGNSPTIENNVFEDNETPIKTLTLLPIFSDNTAQNNSLDGILVSGLGFSDTISEINWRKTSLPYVIESSAAVSSGKTLNIEAGVVVKLKGGGRFYVDGILKAQGTLAEKITFTSLSQAAAGSWHFIKFSASSIGSILDNVIVSYGGWYNASFKSGAIKIENTNVAISNSLFENNLVAGLELENSTTTITNTIFKNHRAKYNYDMEDSMGIWVKNATPVLTSTAFDNNYYGIYVEAGDCPNLSGVTFSTGENANSVNVFCAP